MDRNVFQSDYFALRSYVNTIEGYVAIASKINEAYAGIAKYLTCFF